MEIAPIADTTNQINASLLRLQQVVNQKRNIAELIVSANRCGINEITVYYTHETAYFFDECVVLKNPFFCGFLHEFVSGIHLDRKSVSYEIDFPFLGQFFGDMTRTKRSILFKW